MRKLSVLSLVVLLLFAWSASPASAQERKRPKRRPNPAMAKVEDVADLPRVLLIGDSISIGYTVPVREMLEGEANVHRPLTNCGPTTRGLAEIDKWLGDGKWDVIHFNWGLHDLKYLGPEGQNLADPEAEGSRQQVPIEEYEANLRKLVDRLEQTGATLIWRTTTPIPEGAKGRVVGDSARYNAVARKIMDEHDIAIDDQYSFALKRLDKIQLPANVHFTPAGSRELAQQAVIAIRKAIKQQGKQGGDKAAEGPVVPADAKLRKLAGDFKFVEGPAWDRKETLYFSDIPTAKIYQWTEDEGLSVFKELEGSCNGLFFDERGNLLVCQPKGRQVLGFSPEGKQFVVADSFQGKRLNSPNDVWVDPWGGIFFTDPRYGSMDDLQQDGFHVYYVDPKSQIHRVIDDLVKPNGVVGTADGKHLYVADPGADKTYVYDLAQGGKLSNRRVAAESGSDGLTLDERGNLYVTGKTVRIYSPQGEVVGSIELPETAANLTFGGREGRTLFITARTGLYAIDLNVRGAFDPFAAK